MYKFVRSYVKKNYQWSLEDISAKKLEDALGLYDAIRIVVTWDSDPIEFLIHAEDNVSILSVADKSVTVKAWLESYTDKDLNARNDVKRLRDIKCVRFTDLHEYPVTIERGNHRYNDTAGLAKGTDIDLMISNGLRQEDELGMYNLGKNSVLCVNGRLLTTVAAHGRVYGVDAVTEADTEGSQILSILDFTDIGGCDKIAINESNIKKANRTLNNELTYTSRVVVDVGVSMQGKTPLCVLDGMLKYDKATVRAISDTKVEIIVRHDVAIKTASRRVHEVLPWINPVTVREQGIDVLTFDVVKYLSTNTSFLILVNTDELCINVEAVGSTLIPGFYTHYRAPKGLLRAEDGRLMPYYVNDFNSETVSLAVGDINAQKSLTIEFNKFLDNGTYTQAVKTPVKRLPKEAFAVDLYVF